MSDCGARNALGPGYLLHAQAGCAASVASTITCAYGSSKRHGAKLERS